MGDLIFSYSRKQALADGVLIDVTELAKEVGIKVPVAITATLYNSFIRTEIPSQDTTGRLWDTLVLLVISAKNCNDSTIFFGVSFQLTETEYETPMLKAIIGQGDDGSPVITIMLEDED